MGWVLLIFFGFIVGFAVIILTSKNSFKANQEKLHNLEKSIPDFETTKTIADLENRFALLIDESSKKVCIVNGDSKTVVDYDKLLSVEYIENDNIITKKSTLRTIGGAVVGGVLAGGAGAIVGGLSGNSKSLSKIRSIIIKIMLRDINNPTIEILAFDCKWTVERKPVKPDSIFCTIHSEPAKQIVDVLSVIIDEVDRSEATKMEKKPEVVHQETISIADEIRKLANLRDEGILTQEEFENQKASLLR